MEGHRQHVRREPRVLTCVRDAALSYAQRPRSVRRVAQRRLAFHTMKALPVPTTTCMNKYASSNNVSTSDTKRDSGKPSGSSSGGKGGGGFWDVLGC